jgi:hypothetical protein
MSDRCPTPLEVVRMIERVRARARRGGRVGIGYQFLDWRPGGCTFPGKTADPEIVAANRAAIARAWLRQLP